MCLCLTCNDTGRILAFWSKPGGIGNGYIGCPYCETGRAYEALLRREIATVLSHQWESNEKLYRQNTQGWT